jgi:hypothetical protein
MPGNPQIHAKRQFIKMFDHLHRAGWVKPTGIPAYDGGFHPPYRSNVTSMRERRGDSTDEASTFFLATSHENVALSRGNTGRPSVAGTAATLRVPETSGEL